MKAAKAHSFGGDHRLSGELQRRGLRAAPFLLLVSAVFLGGAAWNLSAVTLSMLGWLILSLAVWLQWRDAAPRWGVIEWFVACFPALLLLTQLLPLPPSVFAALPGRASMQADLELVGAAGVWRPLSLDVSSSFSAIAAMLPAVAMLVSVRTIPPSTVVDLCRWLVGLACLSVLLGFAQVAGGSDSPFRLHDFHNLTGALGFFAYRNHQASFLLMVVPIAVGLMLTSRTPAGVGMSWARALLALAVPVLLLGIVLTFSRAGLVLGVAMLGGCGVLIWTTLGGGKHHLWRLSLIAVLAAFGLLLAVWAGRDLFTGAFGASLWEDGRWGLYARVAEIAWEYQPVGTGLGSFEQVFQRAPENIALLGARMNHVHNEWLQLWLELGWFGALIGLIAFSVLLHAAWIVWRMQVRSRQPATLVLSRAASISLLLASVHAYFDYALRSGTTMVVFALLAALLLRERFDGIDQEQ
jgi:hypothetical protein